MILILSGTLCIKMLDVVAMTSNAVTDDLAEREKEGRRQAAPKIIGDGHYMIEGYMSHTLSYRLLS